MTTVEPYDPAAFDLRFRWVIRQEMQPLGEFFDFPDLEQDYAEMKERIIARLVTHRIAPADVDIPTVKLYARSYVAVAMTQRKREGAATAAPEGPSRVDDPEGEA